MIFRCDILASSRLMIASRFVSSANFLCILLLSCAKIINANVKQNNFWGRNSRNCTGKGPLVWHVPFQLKQLPWPFQAGLYLLYISYASHIFSSLANNLLCGTISNVLLKPRRVRSTAFLHRKYLWAYKRKLLGWCWFASGPYCVMYYKYVVCCAMPEDLERGVQWEAYVCKIQDCLH